MRALSRSSVVLLSSLLVVAFAACSGAEAAQAPAPKVEEPVLTASAGGKTPAATPAARPTAPALTSFPAVDTSRLNGEQKAFFEKLANEEICPCDCPKSLGACLQEGTRCQPAVLLSNWVIGQMEEGLPGELLAQAITKELTAGFTAAPKKPLTDDFASKGANGAPITIVEYADFECGHCKAAAPVVSDLVKKRPDVKVVFKHYPLSIHPMARLAAIATEAAKRQNKFWEMHDAVFATQELLDDKLLLGHAKALGLDIPRFQKDLADPAVAKKVDDSRAEGQSFGIDATPAFFVQGRPYFLSRSVDGFELRLAMEAARSTSSCQ